MPRLACFACGRTIWATVPLAGLFAEERRCPRCGAALHDDRRVMDRRNLPSRREVKAGNQPAGEKRREERRVHSRRRSG